MAAVHANDKIGKVTVAAGHHETYRPRLARFVAVPPRYRVAGIGIQHLGKAPLGIVKVLRHHAIQIQSRTFGTIRRTYKGRQSGDIGKLFEGSGTIS